MIKKITRFYQNELKFERILFNNSNWKLKLYSYSILVYLLLIGSFGIAMMSQRWFLLMLSIPFMIDMASSYFLNKGYFAFVDRKRSLALKTNLEKYIGHYDFDSTTGLFKYRKKKLKEFFKEMGWDDNYEYILRELELKINWEFKKFTFISVGVIAAIIASLKLTSESIINTKDFFAFLTEISKNHTDKIPQELIPTFTITTIFYTLMPIIVAFFLAIGIKSYINHHFRDFWILRGIFQELNIENREILN